MDYPKIRLVEAHPVKDNLICLRDPLMFSDKMLLVPPNVLFIITLFDGKHSIVDIQAAYTRQYGDLLFGERVKEIIQQLDASLFLDNERFREAQRKTIREFREAPVRPATHAGSAYEEEPEKLRAQLLELFGADDRPLVKDTGRLKALMAPHVDIRRGGSCFASSYRELAQASSAHIFVVLGIVHTQTANRFVLTKKDFATPLGLCHTDKGIVESLQARCRTDLFLDEFAHRNEHSIEFQVLFLQYLYAGIRDFAIVPVLCSSFGALLSENQQPDSDDQIQDFISALRLEIEERGSELCCIAGVDLSHVGQRFGQQVNMTADVLQELERHDREMFASILELDAGAFFRFIQAEQDQKNVCGVSAIYTLLKTTAATSAQLLDYQQAVEQDHSVVTFAGAAFYE